MATHIDSSVNRQSCEWLREVAIRLSVVIEVIDARHVLVCPVAPTLEAAAVRRMLTSGDHVLHAALGDATRAKVPVPVTIEGLQILCFGLAPGGMLLVARPPGAHESVEECREDLESIGAWLSGAIEASLDQPNAIGVEPYRIVSFRRILREATVRGSLRKVTGAFVEALSVWDDVRVAGYVAGSTGGFFQYVSTITALPSLSPEQLDEAALPRDGGRMFRLSRDEGERLGLSSAPGDTLILRFTIGSETEWVIVFSGMIDVRVEVRLRVYSDILRESLNEVLTTTTSRVIAEVSRRPLLPTESVESAANSALDQLISSVGGRQGALAVTTGAGRQLLSIGNADLLAAADQSRATRLAVRVSDTSGMITAIVERDQMPFAAFEREIVQAGVAAMHPWLQSSLQRAHESERRQGFRPIDAMFDQLANEAVANGQHASVIVLSVSADMPNPSLLSAWVGRIRGQLRGGDKAGMLSEREIAVLLCGSSADQAAIVSSRLRHMFDADDMPNGYPHPSFGITTRMPNAPFEGSLVGAAREAAIR